MQPRTARCRGACWLGRSLPPLIETATELQDRGFDCKSLTEPIDTTTTTTGGGKLISHVVAALAEFERDVTRERTQPGLIVARARGRRGGHPRAAAHDDAQRVALAQRLHDDRNDSTDDICKMPRVSRPPSAATSGLSGKRPLTRPQAEPYTPGHSSGALTHF